MSNTEGDYDENQQTVEFYKIQLMEKEREISSFQAKFKKAEIKNNRDVKELKIAEEKAKNALKEQRNKLDKSTKKVHQLTEQNNILQHRMAQLKEEKQKQIQSVRSQYNHLKQQVRSYQRILPTHTFLSELGATIQQLPTYQTIFMNWKDKCERFDELDAKFKAFKEQTEQKISLQVKVEESLKKKKNQLQKQLRDDMTKLLQAESQATTFQMERDQLATKFSIASEELQTALQANQELTQTNKALQSKLDEFIIIHNNEMDAKQEQIRRISEEEMRKFEEQMYRMAQNYEIKQNSHLQQLAFLEEQQMRLQEKNQKDKERFEETYRQLYNQVQNIKQILDNQREQLFKQKSQNEKIKKQLSQKCQESLLYLRKLGQNQLKIEQLQNSIKANVQKFSNHKEKAHESLQQAQTVKKEMQERLVELEEENRQLHSELLHKQNEIMVLNNEIEEIKNRGHLMNRSSFPVAFSVQQPDVLRNRKETDESIDIEGNIDIQKISSNILEVQNRTRKASTISQRSVQKRRKKSSSILFTQEQLDQKMKILEEKIRQQCEDSHKKACKNMELKNQQKIQEIEQQYNEQIKSLKKQIQSLQYDIKKLQRDLSTDKQFHEDELGKLKKMHDLLKAEKDAVQQSYITHVMEAKRDKEVLNNFKTNNKELEKTNKQLIRNKEQMQIQIDQLKKFKQKVQAKESTKDKSSSSSQGSSVALKELMEKYNAKITALVTQKEQQSSLLAGKENQIKNLSTILNEKMKKYETIQAQLQEKERENRMLQDLLDHERKDRTLRTVPSLASLPDQDGQEEENFKQFYNQAGQKEGQIAILERDVENLKEELQELKESNQRKCNDMENEMTEYIQQIIRMKMIVAQAEMKASQKTHLYNQLKKKFSIK